MCKDERCGLEVLPVVVNSRIYSTKCFEKPLDEVQKPLLLVPMPAVRVEMSADLYVDFGISSLVELLSVHVHAGLITDTVVLLAKTDSP